MNSNSDFFTTASQLQGAIASNDLVLLKEYNVQAMMAMVNTTVDQFMTFQTFHPRYGRVLVQNDPAAFVSTPLSFMVRQEGGTVSVLYRKPSAVYAPFDLPSSLTSELDRIFSEIAEAAIQ